MNRWINVKDKLPTDNQKVIVFKRTGHITIATYYVKDQFDREKMFVGIGGAHYDLTWIKHWMELPKPPEMSQK